jgi:hypothetical protein
MSLAFINVYIKKKEQVSKLKTTSFKKLTNYYITKKNNFRRVFFV